MEKKRKKTKRKTADKIFNLLFQNKNHVHYKIQEIEEKERQHFYLFSLKKNSSVIHIVKSSLNFERILLIALEIPSALYGDTANRIMVFSVVLHVKWIPNLQTI